MESKKGSNKLLQAIRGHVNIWALSLKNLLKYKERSLAIVIPLMLIMGLVSSMTFIRDGLIRDALLTLSFLPDITIQNLPAGRMESFNLEEILPILDELEGIEKIAPRVWGYVPIEKEAGLEYEVYVLMGIDLEKMPISDDIELSLESGRFLKAGETGNAVIGKAFASGFGCNIGDDIEIKDSFGNQDIYKIIGIFTKAVQIYAADLILTSIEDAREFFVYEQNEASDMCIYVSSPEYIDKIAMSIAQKVRNARVFTREILGDLIKQVYSGRAGIFQLQWLFLLITVIILAWAQSSSVSLEMRREIGILKATGWSIMEIIELKLFESFLLAFFGILSGFILGMVYLLIGAPGIRSYFLGWATVYPDFPIPFVFSLKSLIMLGMIGIFPMLIATLIPSWLVGILEPDKAIRG